MKKFLLLSLISFFAVGSTMAGYSYYKGCQQRKRVNYVELLSPCHQSKGFRYQKKGCDSFDTIARTPRKSMRYTLIAPKPFYAQITSNRTIDNYSRARYGNIENVPLGDQIKFYPDFTSLSPYKNVTWKWHYDSRGLDCIESSAGTLDCVVRKAIPSEVWAEFMVPEYKNYNWGKTYNSNVIKVYPRVENDDMYSDRYPSVVMEYSYPTRTTKKVYPNYNRQPFSYFYYYGY